jgi:hypothetical protein
MTKPPSVQANLYARVTSLAYAQCAARLDADTLHRALSDAFMAGFQSGMKEGEERINELEQTLDHCRES